MPEFFKKYLESLTDEEADELALWFDSADMTNAVEVLVNPRPALYQKWNLFEQLGMEKK